MMTLMYMFGLAAGSLVAYSIEHALGPIDDREFYTVAWNHPETTTTHLSTTVLPSTSSKTIIDAANVTATSLL